MNQNIIDYIKKSRLQGLSDEQIQESLRNAGWQQADIEEGFKKPNLFSKISKKVLLGVVVVVVSGGIGAGIVFLMQTGGVDQESTFDRQRKGIIADWEIYRDREFGYVIQYPSNWRQDALYETQLLFLPEGIEQAELVYPLSNGYISVIDKRGDPLGLVEKDLKQALEGYSGDVPERFMNYSSFILNGLMAYELESFSQPEESPYPLESYSLHSRSSYLEIEPNRTLVLSFISSSETKEEIKETADKIISTFKFLEPEIKEELESLKERKVYVNEELKFKLEYPTTWQIPFLSKGVADSAFPGNEEPIRRLSIQSKSQDECDRGGCRIFYFDEFSPRKWEEVEGQLRENPAITIGLHLNYLTLRGEPIDLTKVFYTEREECLMERVLFISPQSMVRMTGGCVGDEEYDPVGEEIFGIFHNYFEFISSEPVANWQTYRNEEFGFEVKYPLLDPRDIQEVVQPHYPEQTWIYFKHLLNESEEQDTVFLIKIHENKGKLSLQDWFTEEIDYRDLLISNNTYGLFESSLGPVYKQQTGLPLEYVDERPSPGEQLFASPSGEYVFEINILFSDYLSTHYSYGNLTSRIHFSDQILSTFKFIE